MGLKLNPLQLYKPRLKSHDVRRCGCKLAGGPFGPILPSQINPDAWGDVTCCSETRQFPNEPDEVNHWLFRSVKCTGFLLVGNHWLQISGRVELLFHPKSVGRVTGVCFLESLQVQVIQRVLW